MARARNIKPAIWKNELLGSADPFVTLLFIGLWSLADREGRLENRPLRIKVEIFPYREGFDINRYLTVLEQLGFITRYSVDNLDVIQVNTFAEHQSPHKTEKPSVLPENPENKGSQKITVKASLNDGETPSHNALIPDSGYLIPDCGKRKEESKKTPPPTPLPEMAEWFYFEEWLVEAGLDPIRLGLSRPQFKQWHDDGVTRAEFDFALKRSLDYIAGKNRTGQPSVQLVAKILADNRVSANPISAGEKLNTHGGFDKTDYFEGTEGMTVVGGKS